MVKLDVVVLVCLFDKENRIFFGISLLMVFIIGFSMYVLLCYN